ncbi:hypothetical protein S245_066174, partial [Arachis hypogaea]
GIKVKDVDQAMILLTSLPPTYNNFCDTMLYGRSEITVSNIKDALLTKKYQKLVSKFTANNSAN